MTGEELATRLGPTWELDPRVTPGSVTAHRAATKQSVVVYDDGTAYLYTGFPAREKTLRGEKAWAVLRA